MRTRLKWLEDFTVSQPRPGDTFRFDGSVWRNVQELPDFSLRVIPPGETWQIPENQEMAVDRRIEIDGRLEISGRLVVGENAQNEIVFPESPENFSRYKVPSGQTVVVPENQEMFATTLTVEGRVENSGRIAIDIPEPEDDVQEEIPWSIIPNKFFVIRDGFQKWFLNFELAGRLEIQGRGRLIVGV